MTRSRSLCASVFFFFAPHLLRYPPHAIHERAEATWPASDLDRERLAELLG
jgi:hypothetical protein